MMPVVAPAQQPVSMMGIKFCGERNESVPRLESALSARLLRR
jgi:hypothetical protein